MENRKYLEKMLNMQLVDLDGKTYGLCLDTGAELMRFYHKAQIDWTAKRLAVERNKKDD